MCYSNYTVDAYQRHILVEDHSIFKYIYHIASRAIKIKEYRRIKRTLFSTYLHMFHLWKNIKVGLPDRFLRKMEYLRVPLLLYKANFEGF